jgi:hypothetical protein
MSTASATTAPVATASTTATAIPSAIRAWLVITRRRSSLVITRSRRIVTTRRFYVDALLPIRAVIAAVIDRAAINGL